MNTVVVVQARTSSSRLPAKVMLPLGGMPLASLVAKRAGNSGLRVLVATSNQPDDDALAAMLADKGIECFRGSLDDVLGRFVAALAGCDDDDAVVRLTADNPLPDGHFIDEIVADFRARQVDYLVCNGPRSGLPYGLSVEVMRLGRLREADHNTNDPSDREHVTPYVIRVCGTAWFDRYISLGSGHFRSTVDSYDDYQSVLRVFEGESDPVNVPALELTARIKRAPYQPIESAAANKLVVGGAQLGVAYGITNSVGSPTPASVAAMLKCAIANGAPFIDTAFAYTGSEMAIGTALVGGWAERTRVVTKLAPLDDLAQNCEAVTVRARVDASVYSSCVRLRRTGLDVFLLHRASHLAAWDGAAWQRLRELREEGFIRDLGVSVQTPEELDYALQHEEASFVQLPYNLLDWRWDKTLDRLNDERARRSITVHVRSALLQGLLASQETIHWHRAHVPDPSLVQQWLTEQARRYCRSSIVDLCLAFVRAQSWVDGVVVGMETLEQVRENIRHFVAPMLAPHELAAICGERPRLAAETLDPSCWSKP